MLVTAFEPFSNHSQNASEELLDAFPEQLPNIQIIKYTLPVSYEEIPSILEELIQKEKPDAVIALGQGPTKSGFRLELISKNKISTIHKDNQDFKPESDRIDPSHVEELEAFLPLEAILKAFENQNVPYELSENAGSYVCNYTYFHLLNTYQNKFPTAFVHVNDQGDLDNQIQALTILIEEVLRFV